MKQWHWAAIGLFIYVIALLASAPASLLDAKLRHDSKGRFRLADATGTIWSGSGQIEVRDAGGQSGIAKSLQWRLLPESFWRGRLLFDVELDRSAKRFPVRMSLSRIEIASLETNLPASALGLGIAKLAPLRLTGDVAVRVASLSIERGQMIGSLTLQWRDAGSVLTPIAPLGTYELRLDGDGTTVHANLRTIQGPLDLDGKGTWAPGANPAFLATARVAAEHQQQLGPLLRLIAVERSPGTFELVLK